MRDLDLLTASRDAMVKADADQEGAKSNRIVGTAAKNALHRQMIALIDEALGVVEMEFAKEPHILNLFRGPLPTKRVKREKISA